MCKITRILFIIYSTANTFCFLFLAHLCFNYLFLPRRPCLWCCRQLLSCLLLLTSFQPINFLFHEVDVFDSCQQRFLYFYVSQFDFVVDVLIHIYRLLTNYSCFQCIISNSLLLSILKFVIDQCFVEGLLIWKHYFWSYLHFF